MCLYHLVVHASSSYVFSQVLLSTSLSSRLEISSSEICICTQLPSDNHRCDAPALHAGSSTLAPPATHQNALEAVQGGKGPLFSPLEDIFSLKRATCDRRHRASVPFWHDVSCAVGCPAMPPSMCW